VSRVIERRLSRRICPGLFVRPPAQQSPTRRPARPATLGMCYSAITGYLGFEVNEGEYKVMGLAPYGQPKYLKQIGQLIEAGPGGEYRLNLNIIRSYKKTECFPRIFANCWENPPCPYGSETSPFHARALQFWPECAEIMLRVVDFQTRRFRIMACRRLNCSSSINRARCGTFYAAESNVLTWFSAKRSLNPLARLVS